MKAYGKVDIEEGQFVISDMPPHAAIILKRVFPRLGVHTAPPFRFTADDGACVDLRWYHERYPLQWSDAASAAAARGISRERQRQEEAERILINGAPTRLPAFLPGESPFPYQSQAAALCLNRGALLLCDDVGLGKTVSAMALLAMGAPRPAAVVVQAHLSEQWAEEVESLTNLTTHVVTKTTPYALPAVDLVIFRYSNIGGWAEHVAHTPFRTVIWDEIQELRHGLGSAKGRACAALARGADVRLGLTATPIFNYGDEMFNVLQFVAPDLLGSQNEFSIQWCSGRVVTQPVALGHYLRDRGVFLRRTEIDVDKEMPPLNLLPVEVEAEGDDASLDAVAVSLAETLVSKSAGFNAKGVAARELDMRMRHATGIAKAKAVAAYVRVLLEEGGKVLVGAWHRDVYEILLAELAEFNPVLYTGSETAKAKRASREAFISGNSRVMLISVRSGAGLNGLQHVCSDCVLAELDWSPQVHKQLFGRLRRVGQTKQVTAHVLWCDWGSDPSVMDTLGFKADQHKGIVDVGDGALAPVTEEGRIKRLAEEYLARRQGSLNLEPLITQTPEAATNG